MSEHGGHIDRIVQQLVEKQLGKVMGDRRGHISGTGSESVHSIKEQFKVGDDQARKVLAGFRRQMDLLQKGVRKLAKSLYAKYGNRSLFEVMKKARKHLRTYGLSEGDLNLVKLAYETLIDRSQSGMVKTTQPQNVIGKALGMVHPPFVVDRHVSVRDSDRPFLDEIVNIADSTTSKMQYSRSVAQNFSYTGYQPNVLLSRYNPDVHNVSCAVHPILAALFVPRIAYLDDRMLNSNLACIVRDRFNGRPIKYRPDFEFYVDLTTDKNEMVCSTNSVLADLRNRVRVQEQVRNAVWNLRNGKVFECNNTSFVTALDSCRQSSFDAPNLLFSQDEGVLMRRLLSVFALRPTYVTTRSLAGPMGAPSPLGSISQLTMVHVPLPPLLTLLLVLWVLVDLED